MARYMVLRGNINGQDRGPGGHGQIKKLLYVFHKGEVFDTSEIKISKEALEISLRRGNIEPFKEHRGAKPVTPDPLV
jgi:hypothetical protein